ncbi:MAG TPA: hypothetical protein VIH88_02265 [Candidatus Acidoferrales bacterium]
MAGKTIYEKLAGTNGIFAEGSPGNLREGATYSLHISNGELWSGRVAFIMPPRGFCVTVESLNDSLAWFTIERAGATYEAQLWFSTYGLPRERVTQLETRWYAQFQKILKP